MSTCYCCKRRTAVLCSCVISTCRVCLFCLAHCRCAVKCGRLDPAKMAAVDPEDGLDDPSGPFADLPSLQPVPPHDPTRLEDSPLNVNGPAVS